MSGQHSLGKEMYYWAEKLFPINRSITGDGVRQTLAFLQRILPDLVVHSVPSGTIAFDWTVPNEWNVCAAYIEDEGKNRIIDFRDNNLHLLGYSEPVDKWVEYEELQEHLYSLPEQPDAIPYVTSYYSRRWGFCITHKQREQLTKKAKYHVVIESQLKAGVLNYGELILPGQEQKEILISTYICHPSMANNELSGIVVTAAIARELLSRDRRYTYRILFLPETIGSIVYLSRHAEQMQEKTIAGFVVTCVGDERMYSFMPSREGNTLADKVATFVLDNLVSKYTKYSFLDRGSDERQYCSPLIDLPVVSIMRSKYGSYKEYHTSKDNLSFISPKGLAKSFEILITCLDVLEENHKYKVTNPCEPQLGKRGLYPTLSRKKNMAGVREMMNFLAYATGERDIIDLCEKTSIDFKQCVEIANLLLAHNLIRIV